ncbi:MAG: outer membrane beta-barrel protein [Pseudomonadota bacterium]
MLQKLILALTILTASTLVAQTASADGTGWFVGGAVQWGQVDDSLDDDDIDIGDDIEALFDDNAVGFNAGGGYRFNKWLAIDAAYWDLGEFASDRLDDGEKLNFDLTAISLGGIVSVPLWVLDVYGRIGAAYLEADGRFVDADSTEPYFGVGAALNVGGSLDFYLEYVRIEGDVAIDTAGLGVRFTF